MSHATLIRAYFTAYENRDRSAVEAMLTSDFVFTSPYDHRIGRETYFERCWPYSEKGPTYRIEKLFQRANAAFILYESKTRDGGGSRNVELFTIEGTQIRAVEVYFGAATKTAPAR